jgi:hypothetical protein
MTFVAGCPFADPEVAARKLMEIANSVEPVQDGRIHIEKINWPFLSELKGSPAEYGAGLKLAIERDWLWMHDARERDLCEVHGSWL